MEVRVPGVTTSVIRLDEPVQHPDDRHPDIIEDQRHAYGANTVAEVEDYWLDHLTVEPHWDNREAVAYINRGRYLIDCPACNAGTWAWDRNPLACCLECGLMVKVIWQAPSVRAHAIRLLAVRPPEHRNWDAHKGETVEELEVENRWLLQDPTVLKDGLAMPLSLRP